MTSALQRLQANEDDIIWRQNASTIRQLYQEKKKTLKEVKKIMENERGFPETPLSIWEVKLRGLGMQKKLKSRDWSLVYQHVRPRLQHEGKKKLRKPTAVLINDTKKSWDDVWREIRRNRALIQRPHRGPLPPLPPGIIIRTPSPDLLKTTLQKFKSQSPQSLILQLFQTTLVSLQPLLEVDQQSTVELSDVTMYPTPDSLYRMCLQGIPFTILLEKLSATIQEALPSPDTVATSGGSQTHQITSAFRPSNDPTAAGQVKSWKSQLTSITTELLPGFESASPPGQELQLNFDNHHYLSMVIYLLSNDMVPTPLCPEESHEVTMSEILQMTFKFVPRRSLLALFHTDLPSIRAAWEKLLLGAQKLKNKEAFRLFISVGMENDWLDNHGKGHEYLFSAAQMNCSDIMHALIARGCRTDSYPSWCTYQSTIVEALENGNLDCAKLLIQHCDVNQEFGTQGSTKSTHFAKFIIAFDGTRPDHLHCMELFLERGADVDYQLDPVHMFHQPNKFIPWYWNNAITSGILDEWPVSILDYVYYCHRSLFPKLAKYSGTASRLTRARALGILDQGVDTLREYLASDPDFPRLWEQATGNDTNEEHVCERNNHFLEILLAEQCLLGIIDCVDEVWWTRMKGFSVLEIDLTWLSKTGELASTMLQTAAKLITSEYELYHKHGFQMMQWLLNKGFRIDADALQAAFLDPDVVTLDTLDCLASFCDNLKEEGAEVLATAVYKDDFNATEMLLDRGVDINPTDPEHNVFESAACGSTFAMMEYVVQRGAKPRTWEHGDQRSHLLFRMFDGPGHDLFIKVQDLVENYITIDEPSFPSANFLEACISFRSFPEERRRTFEYLWKRGAKLSPGSPLAQWIAAGGGHRLVQEMLDAGADTNGRSSDLRYLYYLCDCRGRTPLQAAAGIGDYNLVCMLMDRGADVNGPAFGDYGKTALQAICAWDPVRQEERLRKDKIITLFLDEGADVNATNSRGQTALMHAARQGDLSSAFRLLKYGAKVNMATSRNNFDLIGTALDTAARNGRLDMVEFLLNASALSSTADSDGKDYDGAIRLAREGGHFVVSELICKYSADRKIWDVPHGQAVDTRTPPELASQMLSPRAKSGATSWTRSERPFSPSVDIRGVVTLDQIDGLINAFEEGMVESSTAASKAVGRGMSGAEATDMSCTRVIEEIEDEPLLADSGCERPGDEKSYGAGHQAVDTNRASSGPGGWLYQPREQNWVENEQQDVDPLVSSNSSTDVFMGFSEFPSP